MPCFLVGVEGLEQSHFGREKRCDPSRGLTPELTSDAITSELRVINETWFKWPNDDDAVN